MTSFVIKSIICTISKASSKACIKNGCWWVQECWGLPNFVKIKVDIKQIKFSLLDSKYTELTLYINFCNEMEFKGWKLSLKHNTMENLLVESKLFTGMPQGIGHALLQFKDTLVKVLYRYITIYTILCLSGTRVQPPGHTEYVGCWVRDDSSHSKS